MVLYPGLRLAHKASLRSPGATSGRQLRGSERRGDGLVFGRRLRSDPRRSILVPRRSILVPSIDRFRNERRGQDFCFRMPRSGHR